MAEDNLKDKEDKIDAGFRGVNARLDALVGHVSALDGTVNGLDGRVQSLDGRVQSLDGRVHALDGRVHALDGRVTALDTGVNARLDTLDAGFSGVSTRLDTLDAGFSGVSTRLDTMDTGLADLRADFGELKAHLFEVRDALLADNVKNRDFVSIKVEALRAEVKVYADGLIAHTEKLEDHETRITKLETQ